MPYKKFFEGGSEDQSFEDQSLYDLTRLLTNRNIRVLWKHAETLMFKQKDKGIYGKTIFYVFYQDIKEELQQEQESFKSKLEIAREVSTDERYYKLKNARQRELYMLSEHFLSKTEAQDVIELLKPELAQIINDSENDEDVLYGEPIESEPKPKAKQPKVKSVKTKKRDIGNEDIDKELDEFEKELEEIE